MIAEEQRFPKSFPTPAEVDFLKLVLSSDYEFPQLFSRWRTQVVFEDIDYATLRLLPLLHLRLRALKINDPVAGRIQGVYRLAWVRNQRLLDAVDKISQLLDREGVPVLFLKGIPLLVNVYKDAGARFLGDVDILIDPRHTKRAIQCLLDAGWRLTNPLFPRLDDFSNESLSRIVKEATFDNDQKIEVDLHWRLFELTGEQEVDPMPFEDLWTRAANLEFKGRAHRTLCPEDMLLHVVVHGAEGNSHRTMRWVADAVMILRSFPIDWEKLITASERYGWQVHLRMAFTFLIKHGFVQLPQSVAASLTSLHFTNQQLRRYYSRGDVPYRPWGGFPRLWKTYWKHESRGHFPATVYFFLEYLSKAWGLPSKMHLPVFVLSKYKQRWLSRLK